MFATLASPFANRSQQHRYTKLLQIKASMGAVYTLAISHDGQALASGGEL
jgi:hypothetical protein